MRTSMFLVLSVPHTTLAILISTSLASSLTSAANMDPESHVSPTTPVAFSALDTYWTPTRIANAKPMPLPLPSFEMSELGTAEFLEDGTSEGSAPYEPPNKAMPLTQVSLIQPESQPDYESSGVFELGDGEFSEGELSDGVLGKVEIPLMISPKGYPFTTRRVSPDPTVTSSPFLRAGKLFFTKPDGNYVCSAALINRRILLTAAHCVYDRQTKKFYRNWLYVPAYNGAVATNSPYCQWTINYSTVPAQWASSSGYPATDDFAVLVVNDRTCNSGTTKLVIGHWLGYFGWSTNRLIGNNITQLGYPNNLDSGARMQITQSNVYRRASYAGEIGSAQGQGTSGGPWVQNFGVVPSGRVAIGGSGYTGSNQVVGVSSYGEVNHDSWQYGGSSVLNDNFVRIFNTACGKATGNCN